VSPAVPGLRLGRIGAWLNPVYGDDARAGLAIQAESLGFPTVWLGFGRAPVSNLALVERILDATSTITVATGIVNMWTNDAAEVAATSVATASWPTYRMSPVQLRMTMCAPASPPYCSMTRSGNSARSSSTHGAARPSYPVTLEVR
jgi:hypothetical protein